MRMVQKLKTTYTPHIVGVTPTAEPAKSVDVKEQLKRSTVTFNGGTTTLDGKQVTVDIDPATFTLLDETGTQQHLFQLKTLVEMLLVHIL